MQNCTNILILSVYVVKFYVWFDRLFQASADSMIAAALFRLQWRQALWRDTSARLLLCWSLWYIGRIYWIAYVTLYAANTVLNLSGHPPPPRRARR